MDPKVSYTDMILLAKEGSPMLINSVARLAGLGENERKELTKNGIPVWAWAVLAGVAGVVVGVRIHRSMPDSLPSWVTGK